MSQPLIDLQHISKSFDGELILDDLNLSIRENSFVTLLGPSGCGKSTTLYLISGLESPTSGRIFFGDRDVTALPPEKRGIGLVFQNYALYPNMKVKDNIAFPLKMRHTGKQETKSRVAEVARKLELDTLLERKPGALSGGQRQRVALARSMVRKPKLFLMDEPLANLDARLRTEMRREIITLQRELGVTTIYVTHDQTEAMTMGTRIAVINEGVLQQFGTPQEVYRHPANLFVAGFIGSPNMNLWDTEPVAEQGHCYLTLGHARIPMDKRNLPPDSLKGGIKAGIRPEHIMPAASGEPGAIQMKINILENTGREMAVFLTAPGMPELTMITGANFSGQPGQSVSVRLLSEKIHLFHKETGQAL